MHESRLPLALGLNTRNWIIVMGVIGLGMVWAAIAAFAWFRVPTVGLLNDTTTSVWVVSCSEVGTLAPGQRERVAPSRPCSVFLQPGQYVGCLDIPDDVLLSSGTIGISTMRKDLTQPECADLDDYHRLSRFRRIF